MQKRGVRIALLTLLLAIGAGAGIAAWSIDAERRALIDYRDNIAERLDRVLTAISEIGFAQQAYVAPGQSSQGAVELTAAQIQRIYAELEAVRPSLRSTDAAELIEVISDGAAALRDADGSARGHLQTDQLLWAAEVVFGQARDTRATMTQAVKALQAAESRTLRTEDRQLAQMLWGAVGGAAATWVMGMILLTWVPRSAAAAQIPIAEQPSEAPAVPAQRPSEPLAAPPPEAAEPASRVDLSDAAALCTDISRLTSGDAVPELLARTAAIIDASGIILWMGAGEELFPAAAHGYDTHAVSRLGAIARSADNVTAAACRHGEVRFVPRDGASNGAVVAPMFGPDGCVGVLAAEVRHGREADEATRAVAAMIAAQLATVLSAWPAPSTVVAEPPAEHAPDGQRLREASGL